MSICNNCCFGFPELLHESKVFFFLREYSSFKTHFQLFSKNDYFLKTFFAFVIHIEVIFSDDENILL